MWAETISINFEGNAIPSGWTSSNFTVVSNPISGSSATNGSYAASTNGKESATLKYNSKISNVTSVSVQAGKTSTNSNTNLYIEFSPKSDFSSSVTSQQITNIPRNDWGNNTLTLASATDGYVRIRWAGTTAVKYIDNIVITYSVSNKVATPTFTPNVAYVVSGTEVSINCGTSDATIYYTIDGSTPTTTSTEYNPASKPTITAYTTIKAFAVKEDMTDSEIATATYTIAEPCATPTFSPGAGVIGKEDGISITSTAGATIHYTTDGTDPTTSSTTYSSAIKINAATTIKAIAVKDGYAQSAIGSASYTVRDYAILPFNWAGGTKAELNAISGVATNADNSDYAESHKAYRVKFNGDGKYVVVKTDDQPGVVTMGVKMIGGSASSTITVQESADGETYTNIEDLIISGSTNDIVNLTSTKAFKPDSRYVRLYYTKGSGSNVGVGPITISAGATISLSSYCTDGVAYYATYSNSRAFIVPGDITVSEISVIDGDLVVEDYDENDIVPANTGVMISSNKAGNHAIILTSSAGSSKLGSDNMLKPTGEGITSTAMEAASASGTKFYRLTMHNADLEHDILGTIGFWYGAEGGVAFDYSTANRAYLAVPSGAQAPARFWFTDEENGATNIEAVEAAEEGVKFIQNGKLFIKKNGVVYNMLGTVVR